jgi:hypothetical protein
MANATAATVMDAIFAMDAYNHDSGTGAWASTLTDLFPDLVNGQLGNYSVSNVSSVAEQSLSNFFAIAYESTSQTVISYRGTTSLYTDAMNGYDIGVRRQII